MDAFYERLLVRAATIDEVLSDDFEALPGQKGDVDLAAERLAAWCRSCASGDWSLFGRRLARDGLTIEQVLTRFATVRRKPSAACPPWIEDAIWIEMALQSPAADPAAPEQAEPLPFEQLFAAVVAAAEERLWLGMAPSVAGNLTETARAGLRHALLSEISGLATPVIYERFVKARKAAGAPDAPKIQQDAGTCLYDRFIADMKAGGFRSLFEEKPLLLRLMASMTRQWIDSSRELLLRLDADLPAIRRDLLRSAAGGRIAGIEGDISDPHNSGRSVKIVRFEDGARIVYKPKDLRLDAVWHALVERLNRAAPPIDLRAVRALARDGYGWTEFIDHSGCADEEGFRRFFRRAGAWLALLHGFAANDMHQENMIAAGDHPVPIDLETILQASAERHKAQDPDDEAYEAATDIVANSVMTVGLLPAYGRSIDNKVFAIGGMTADWNAKIKLSWSNINSDAMRPAKSKEVGVGTPNLPHIGGRYARFVDYGAVFLEGFTDFAKFLLRQSRDADAGGLFDGFSGVAVRKVIRPTRFYYMLLQRLKNHQAMQDGVLWSAQADFIARLSDWEKASDPLWPLQRAERAALLTLNVPYFVSMSDGSEVRDASGISIESAAGSGLVRARARVRSLDEREIGWQVMVIEQNVSMAPKSAAPAAKAAEIKQLLRADAVAAPTPAFFRAEADKIAEDIARYAVRRGPGAAWIGLDWLGDSDVFQLVCLGPELYNGTSGIAVFLAAHAAVTGHAASRELALAAVAHLRKSLRGRNAARVARSLGVGGAIGLGSVVYALTVMAKSLGDHALRADANVAAELFSDDLIAADKQLDVMGGSAGAILALLRLYRDSGSEAVLRAAIKCGEHLTEQSRRGPDGRQCWVGQGLGEQALNGMSHGAAGFAYALASLAAASGRGDFREAAAQCIAFENSSYDPERNNWPDLRGSEPTWPCQWCHGAAGVGLARAAMIRRGGMDAGLLAQDVNNAVEGARRGWPGAVDTLCCGTLGSIEFFCEAGNALGRSDLRERAAQQLARLVQAGNSVGDYRWNNGARRFNLGLFRGLAGVGYTALRRLDPSLPNVLIWE